MNGFGPKLRAAREAKNLTVSQLAEQTHLLAQVIEGLENETFNSIPAPIYGRGFVKLYCEAVELDPKPMVALFMECFSGEKSAAPAPATEPPPPPPPVAAAMEKPVEVNPSRGMSQFRMPPIPWRLIVIAIGALLLIWLIGASLHALFTAQPVAAEPLQEPLNVAEAPMPAPPPAVSKDESAPAKPPRKPIDTDPLYLD